MKVLDCEVGYRYFKQCKTNDMKCATCNSVIIMGYPYLRYLYHKALSKTINIYLLEAYMSGTQRYLPVAIFDHESESYLYN